jgi:hypothetical protein
MELLVTVKSKLMYVDLLRTRRHVQKCHDGAIHLVHTRDATWFCLQHSSPPDVRPREEIRAEEPPQGVKTLESNANTSIRVSMDYMEAGASQADMPHWFPTSGLSPKHQERYASG